MVSSTRWPQVNVYGNEMIREVAAPEGPMTHDSTWRLHEDMIWVVWFRVCKAWLGPERPDLGSERPDLGSERLDFKSGRPGLKLQGGDGNRKNYPMWNHRSSVPLGPLPKSCVGSFKWAQDEVCSSICSVTISIWSCKGFCLYSENNINFRRLLLLNELSYRPQIELILKSWFRSSCVPLFQMSPRWGL